VEAGTTPSIGLGAELDRIEAAVDAGDTDLRRLGFWRVVALIKLDDELIERHADQVGRIDRDAFRQRVRFRVPVWVGNLIFAVELAVGVGAFALAATRGTHNITFAYDATLAGIGLLVTAGTWDVGVHSPTHWLVGRAVGIRFTDYFLKAPTAPPGLKIDYASYLRASPEHRAWMHASGAIATKLVPFLVLALALATGIDAPGWSIAILWVLGIGQIVTDILFSTRKSDWKKVRRELAVARARGDRSG
jgi:hypothetical protein